MLFVRFLLPVLMVVLGLGVGVLLSGREERAWRYYFIGAMTFVLSQVLHIPFNAWLINPKIEALMGRESGLLILSVLLGLSAGVFEEVGRYFAYRFAAKDARSWRAGLMMGAGHGGIEAVLLGLLALFQIMQLTVLRGEGAALLMQSASVEEIGRVQSMVSAFWALPWYGVLLGALERFFAICFHLSASLLVLQAFRRRNLAWVLAAVAWHAVLDAVTVYVNSVWGTYWTEAMLGVLTAVSLVMIFLLRDGRGDGDLSGEEDGERQALLDLERVDVSRDQIEGSRYQ